MVDLMGKSSTVDMLSQVGEAVGVDPSEVIAVAWPEDMMDSRLAP